MVNITLYSEYVSFRVNFIGYDEVLKGSSSDTEPVINNRFFQSDW